MNEYLRKITTYTGRIIGEIEDFGDMMYAKTITPYMRVGQYIKAEDVTMDTVKNIRLGRGNKLETLIWKYSEHEEDY